MKPTMKPLEADWKKFRAMVPELRERYLCQCNRQLCEILQDEALTPTDQFWTAMERVQKIARILRDCLDGHSRSRMMESMMLMYHHRMLNDEDMNDFSDQLCEWLRAFTEARSPGLGD